MDWLCIFAEDMPTGLNQAGYYQVRNHYRPDDEVTFKAPNIGLELEMIRADILFQGEGEIAGLTPEPGKRGWCQFRLIDEVPPGASIRDFDWKDMPEDVRVPGTHVREGVEDIAWQAYRRLPSLSDYDAFAPWLPDLLTLILCLASSFSYSV